MMRDVRMFQIGGGTTQAQLNMIARSVFRRKFDLRKEAFLEKFEVKNGK